MRKLMFISMGILTLYSGASLSNSAPSLPHNELVFEVVQDQYIFNHTNIEKAAVLENKNGMYTGLHLKLKQTAAPLFERFSRTGMQRRVNLVFNNKIISTTVIQSPLKDDLLITGISREDALQFLDELRRKRAK